MKNYDEKTVHGFGREWAAFDQSHLKKAELEAIFSQYFTIFPWDKLSNDAVGYDLGCGSGRWASLVAPKVGQLYCLDASSDALQVAKANLAEYTNVKFIEASVDTMPFHDNSMDFGYSLGVLHHIPDTQAGIQSCVKKLKPGAPFLVYLYYAFDNKPNWYRTLWKLSDIFRKGICRLPFRLKYFLSQFIALFIYYPLARSAYLLEKLGLPVKNMPLSAYRNRSFYVMRTDALDRFGTRLEKRYNKKEITDMMEAAGLENIVFNTDTPHWCAVGCKKSLVAGA